MALVPMFAPKSTHEKSKWRRVQKPRIERLGGGGLPESSRNSSQKTGARDICVFGVVFEESAPSIIGIAQEPRGLGHSHTTFGRQWAPSFFVVQKDHEARGLRFGESGYDREICMIAEDQIRSFTTHDGHGMGQKTGSIAITKCKSSLGFVAFAVIRNDARKTDDGIEGSGNT